MTPPRRENASALPDGKFFLFLTDKHRTGKRPAPPLRCTSPLISPLVQPPTKKSSQREKTTFAVVAVAILSPMTFADWMPDRSDCIPQRFSRGRIQHGLRQEDLQLNRRLTHRSHDGLLITAWVLEEWPGRLPFLVRELRVAEPRRQLLMWEPMSESVSMELNALIL